MKFDGDRIIYAFDRWLDRRDERRAEWHKWFAWYPVSLSDEDAWCWLEVLERKIVYHAGLRTIPGWETRSYRRRK